MTVEHPTRRRGLTLAFGAAGISGVAVFVNGYGVSAVPDPAVYTTAKNLVAAALLGAAVAAAGRLWPPTAPRAPRRRPAVALGLLAVAVVGGSVPFLLFFEGLARASSTHAAFLHKTLVVWVALLAVPLLAERVRVPHAAAVGLLLAGFVLLDGGLAGFRMGTGEWLILAATLLWAVEVVLVKRLLREVAPGLVAVARLGVGVLLLLAFLGVTGRLGGLVEMGAVGWAWTALTGAVLAGYVATWFAALALAPALDVTAVLVVGAVITGLLSAVADGTAVPAAQGLGMLLLLAGAAVVAVAGRPGSPATGAMPAR